MYGVNGACIHNPEYILRFLSSNDIAQILGLQAHVSQTLTDPTSYYLEPAEFFHDHLKHPNSAMGIFYRTQLLGFHFASFPGLSETNLGQDIGLCQEALLQVAQLGPAAVHPAYRNKGLLTLIHKAHLHRLKELGYRHFLLTIAPNNYPSIKVTMTQGFIIKQLQLKYHSLLRYILHLDMHNRKIPQTTLCVPSADINAQNRLLALGFYGYDAVKNSGGFDILFGCDTPRSVITPESEVT
ncbi:N-acetyltransferase family protein [Sporomusa aerivorans]|uniref:GNAT family N-acetyltransferase n=1 Tax=Sporomusa aerivorans TaxID=204936 RepID=UPI00352A922D